MFAAFGTLATLASTAKFAHDTVQSFNSGSGAVTLAIGTFVSYFGIDAYKSITSAIHNGVDSTSEHRVQKRHEKPADFDDIGKQVFISGVIAIIVQWIQYQGALRMRDKTMREAARLRRINSMSAIDRSRLGGDAGERPMIFYDAYKDNPYYSGGNSYMNLGNMTADISSIIVRPIINVIVGVAAHVEQIFFQTGNLDHLHVLGNLFKSIGYYEIMVYSLRKHDWSLIQNALKSFLTGPRRINVRR